MRESSDGSVYLNFPGFQEDADMTERNFGDAHEWLVALKDRYDPTNLFEYNQNIESSTE